MRLLAAVGWGGVVWGGVGCVRVGWRMHSVMVDAFAVAFPVGDQTYYCRIFFAGRLCLLDHVC